MEPDPNCPGRFLVAVSAAWRDLLRGYSDRDIISAERKLAQARNKEPGALTPVTKREHKAIVGERLIGSRWDFS